MRPKWRWLVAGGSAFGLAATLLVAALVTGLFAVAIPSVHLLILGTLALTYGLRSIKGARFRDGVLEVHDGRVVLDGRLLACTDEIEQAFVVPTEAGTLVRLEPRGMRVPIWLRVKDAEAGGALLRAVGHDASQAAAEMRIASGLLAMSLVRQLLMVLVPIPLVVAGIAGLALVLGHAAGPFAFALPLLLLSYVFVLAFSPTTVRVGTDGVMTQWLGRERFVPYASVASVETHKMWIGGKEQQGVVLSLSHGEVVRLPTGQTDIGESDAARLARRIEEARAARSTADAASTGPALARRGRRPLEWVTALRRVGAGANADIRTAAVPLDALVQLVEDASAAPVERASAAVAALPYADSDARRRIRVAAEATASPKLRIALDRLGRGDLDDDAIAGTLEELEEEDARARDAAAERPRAATTR